MGERVLTASCLAMLDTQTLAIGCFASLCRDRLADPMVAFSAARPDVAIGVHEMSDAELLPAVMARRVALAIRPGGAAPGFAGCDLWDEHVVVALAAGHPLAAHEQIDAQALAGDVMLVSRDRARAQVHRFLIGQLFRGAAPPARIVADSRHVRVLERVALGEGIALLCESQVDAGLGGLTIRPIAGAAFRMRAHWLAEGCSTALATLVALLEASRE